MGRNGKLYGYTTIILLSLCLVGFQNWDYIDLKDASIGPVNEQVRLGHARELLGKYYKGKYSKVESIKDLNKQILDHVTARMPKAYKKVAPKVVQTLIEEAEKHNLDPVFIMAMIETESSFNPKAHGMFGEIGLMQIKPDTAKWIADKSNMKFLGPKSLENPVQNVKLGVAYVAFLRNNFNGTPSQYITAYNMGQTKLRRMIANKQKPKVYALKVMGNYKELYAEITNSKPTRQASAAKL